MPLLFSSGALQFEWNSAAASDWPKIKMLFVAAYVSAYKGCAVADLDLNAELVNKANVDKVDPLQCLS